MEDLDVISRVDTWGRLFGSSTASWSMTLFLLKQKGRWWKCHFSFAHRLQQRWFLVSDRLKLRRCVSTAAIQSSCPVMTVEHKATVGPRMLFTAQILTMRLWFWAAYKNNWFDLIWFDAGLFVWWLICFCMNREASPPGVSIILINNSSLIEWH